MLLKKHSTIMESTTTERKSGMQRDTDSSFSTTAGEPKSFKKCIILCRNHGVLATFSFSLGLEPGTIHFS